MFPITKENAPEHAALLQVNYDKKSPFYRMVKMKEFWERPPEEKALVHVLLPKKITNHIQKLYTKGQL